MIAVRRQPKEQPMPTRIVFAAPGVKGGVLTQVFAEAPDQVLEAFMAAAGMPFKLTAHASRKEAVYVNPSAIAYWIEYTRSRAFTPSAAPADE
jgi:hypothetical protein